ncbi:MAG: hypothetical protein QOD75_3093 [Blastocatellia bacterium]|nr:hypothetical protein [Blastocatellia bacterium]
MYRLAPQLFSRVICRALAIAFYFIAGVGVSVWAQDTPCPFDKSSLGFAGTPLEQAKCLLRPIVRGGHPGAQPKKLPQSLEKIIGTPARIEKSAVRRYLDAHKIAERDIGGSLDEPLSVATLPDSSTTSARYFVIHDVSTPNYLDKSFPANINEATWEWNDLAKHWSKTAVAHIFVNRLGESVTAVSFGSVLAAKRFGTKFARDNLQERAKGLQIHVELVQPRRSDPAGKPGNDAIAPLPGFTEAQMDRLALLYVAAGVRRGEWLVPAFHAALDAGIADAHDDPQNFDLDLWARRLDALLKQLK